MTGKTDLDVVLVVAFNLKVDAETWAGTIAALAIFVLFEVLFDFNALLDLKSSE